jgi:uncharacterized membrane protein
MTGQASDIRVCVLLACFAGHKRAAKTRREIGKRIRRQGDSILDEVVLSVDPDGRVQVHDPRKTTAGTLTAGATWGLFGLVTGGVQGFGIWAVLGVICGGLFSYYKLNRVTKDEHRRIGEHLPADSSALASFVKGSDPQRILACAAPSGPLEASVASIGPDLSARVWNDSNGSSGRGARHADTPARATQLSMLLVRYAGERSARRALATAGSGKDAGPDAPLVELVVEANERGKRRVIDPTMGPAAVAKADIVSWGAFGLVYGALAGFVSDGGPGVIESTVGWGIACGVFGIVAGALFGLWASRSVSARRLKGIGPLVPPDSSLALGWAGSSASTEAIDGWIASGSQRMVMRFVADERGLHLDVPTL